MIQIASMLQLLQYCALLKSYLYLKGIEIDFSSDMLNGGFKIVNPNAERTCGCGTSFSV